MTSLALLSLKTMIVLGTCNSSPVCCSRYLLISNFLFEPCQIPARYRYIDAPYFSYVDEDCCMKSTMIRQLGFAIVASKKVLEAKGPPIGSPLLFVSGAAHAKRISYMSKRPPIRSPLIFVCSAAQVKSMN
jgi:hypothetical protein